MRLASHKLKPHKHTYTHTVTLCYCAWNGITVNRVCRHADFLKNNIWTVGVLITRTHTKLAGARYRDPTLQLLHRWPDDADVNILFLSEHNTPAVLSLSRRPQIYAMFKNKRAGVCMQPCVCVGTRRRPRRGGGGSPTTAGAARALPSHFGYSPVTVGPGETPKRLERGAFKTRRAWYIFHIFRPTVAVL